jgi:hypothetical protein
MSAHLVSKSGSGLGVSQPRTRCGRSAASFKKAPDRAVRDTIDDAAFDSAAGPFATAPMAQWQIAVCPWPLAGQRDNRADLLWRECRRSTQTRRIGQARRDRRGNSLRRNCRLRRQRCSQGRTVLGQTSSWHANSRTPVPPAASRIILARSDSFCGVPWDRPTSSAPALPQGLSRSDRQTGVASVPQRIGGRSDDSPCQDTFHFPFPGVPRPTSQFLPNRGNPDSPQPLGS